MKDRLEALIIDIVSFHLDTVSPSKESCSSRVRYNGFFFETFKRIMNDSNGVPDPFHIPFFHETAGTVADLNTEVRTWSFDRKYTGIDGMQTAFLRKIKSESLYPVSGLSSTISYIIGELVCNIQEHSGADKGYLAFDINEMDEVLELCIADNGISIPGSYLLNGRKEYMKVIGFDSLEALKYSVRGISTKNRPESESRGYGISTTQNIIANGLGGSIVILTGNTLYFSYKGQEMYMRIPESSAFGGTIYFISIPYKNKSDFNLIEYIS